jgi:hypothetical protein
MKRRTAIEPSQKASTDGSQWAANGDRANAVNVAAEYNFSLLLRWLRLLLRRRLQLLITRRQLITS